MKKGFTMFLNGKDYFFITTCKSTQSKVLLSKVCAFFNAPVNENTVKFLKSRLSVATLEFNDFSTVIKTASGSVVTPYDDESTVIVPFTQKNRSQATQKNIDKIKSAVETAKALYLENPDNYHVKISNDNEKTGDISSASTVPFIYCPACAKETCGPVCYAFAMALNGQKPDVLKSWAMNTAIALLDPGKYFREISAAMKNARYFRYHVSGEILGPAYFESMVQTAVENPGTDILCFTKNYPVVNAWIKNHGGTSDALPKNLHILFSAWEDKIVVDNPYNLPTTDVLNETEKPTNGMVCGGNCFFCACVGVGCWQLKNGQKLYFYKH